MVASWRDEHEPSASATLSDKARPRPTELMAVNGMVRGHDAGAA
jgi:hypothetical protein